MDLTDQVALITGAGNAGGIGFACARLLSSLGARVVLTSTTDRIHDRASGLGGEALGVVADLTVSSEADRVVEAALDRFGGLDVLVNNAGMTSVSSPDESDLLVSTTDEMWRAGLDRNLTTAFNVTRAVMPGMVERGYGRVVIVGSVTGAAVALRGSGVYGAAKAALVGIARTWALEVGKNGVTVNVVAPGWVATPSLTEDEVAAGADTPMGRAARPEEIGAAVAFLASPEASYVNGAVLVVDGGNTIAEIKGG